VENYSGFICPTENLLAITKYVRKETV